MPSSPSTPGSSSTSASISTTGTEGHHGPRRCDSRLTQQGLVVLPRLLPEFHFCLYLFFVRFLTVILLFSLSFLSFDMYWFCWGIIERKRVYEITVYFGVFFVVFIDACYTTNQESFKFKFPLKLTVWNCMCVWHMKLQPMSHELETWFHDPSDCFIS